MFPSGDKSAESRIHEHTECFGIFFFFFISGSPSFFLPKMWFYGNFFPNEDVRAFLAFIKMCIAKEPHLTEAEKCKMLHIHLYMGQDANNWYYELETLSPEVLASWTTLHFCIMHKCENKPQHLPSPTTNSQPLDYTPAIPKLDHSHVHQ